MTASDFPDGIITLDTPEGRRLGFTSDAYEGWLWKLGDAVYISFIVSHQPGNFRRLVEKIHALGLTVKVPTPLGRMRGIVERNGYRCTTEVDPKSKEKVEVWVLEPSA